MIFCSQRTKIFQCMAPSLVPHFFSLDIEAKTYLVYTIHCLILCHSTQQGATHSTRRKRWVRCTRKEWPICMKNTIWFLWASKCQSPVPSLVWFGSFDGFPSSQPTDDMFLEVHSESADCATKKKENCPWAFCGRSDSPGVIGLVAQIVSQE